MAEVGCLLCTVHPAHPGPRTGRVPPGLGQFRASDLEGVVQAARSPVSLLIHFMWPFQGVLTGPQEGCLEGQSFLLHRGLCPQHSIRGQHLLGETKHLPSTSHQTVTLCLCQGTLPACALPATTGTPRASCPTAACRAGPFPNTSSLGKLE